MITSIKLHIPISDLNEELLRNLDRVFSNNKGNTIVKVFIYDPLEKVYVEMFSRSHRVDLSTDLMDFIKSRSEIEFKIE